MILAVNIENTCTSFGLIEGGEIISPVIEIKTDRQDTAYSYAVQIKGILSLANITPVNIEGAILSSVVPELTSTIKEAIRLSCGKSALVVGAGVKTGLHIKTDDPGTVASDLVASAVAVKELYSYPAAIVDLDTATTVMVLDNAGRYIGGAFMAGVGISLDKLAEVASLLPSVELAPPKHVISSSTAECMKSGAIYGTAGAVDGILNSFRDELGYDFEKIVLTGKYASLISPYMKNKTVLDSHLLLKGLGLIYYKNRK